MIECLARRFEVRNKNKNSYAPHEFIEKISPSSKLSKFKSGFFTDIFACIFVLVSCYFGRFCSQKRHTIRATYYLGIGIVICIPTGGSTIWALELKFWFATSNLKSDILFGRHTNWDLNSNSHQFCGRSKSDILFGQKTAHY